MQTDPARVRRSDPGDPDKCPVWDLHKIYSSEETKSWVQTGCRSAGIGCLDCKKPLIDSVVAEIDTIRKRAREYEENPEVVREHRCRGLRARARSSARDDGRRAGRRGTGVPVTEHADNSQRMLTPNPGAVEPPPQQDEMPFAIVDGEPVTVMPRDLYIPPQALEVFLEAFEGPLDLLLYLIRRQNLDVLDIPIADITRQYMEYIQLMQELDLELAGEYLLMAAMLAEIKSRMLLPRSQSGGEEEDDPRAELVRRLQEYERFKRAAEDIDRLDRLDRDVYQATAELTNRQVIRLLPEITLQEMLVAFKDVVQRADDIREPACAARNALGAAAHVGCARDAGRLRAGRIRESFPPGGRPARRLRDIRGIARIAARGPDRRRPGRALCAAACAARGARPRRAGTGRCGDHHGFLSGEQP